MLDDWPLKLMDACILAPQQHGFDSLWDCRQACNYQVHPPNTRTLSGVLGIPQAGEQIQGECDEVFFSPRSTHHAHSSHLTADEFVTPRSHRAQEQPLMELVSGVLAVFEWAVVFVADSGCDTARAGALNARVRQQAARGPVHEAHRHLWLIVMSDQMERVNWNPVNAHLLYCPALMTVVTGNMQAAAPYYCIGGTRM